MKPNLILKGDQMPGPLPSCDNGIAKKYPKDSFIEGQGGVVLFDDFESYDIGALPDTKWRIDNLNNIVIATDYIGPYYDPLNN